MSLAPETRILAPGASPAVASIDDLAWMTGSWEGQGLGGQVLENYSPPAGGQMPGHFRLVKDGQVGSYELITVAEVGNSIEYRVKHFNPDMTGWEEKAEVVRFRLVAVEKDVWFFDGLTIRRTGPDAAVHVIRVRNEDGSHHEANFTFSRAMN